MLFTSHKLLDNDLVEREFALGDIPGMLWTPASSPAPLIILGHQGGLRSMYPRLVGRARHAAASGFATVALELPGGGDRPRLPELEQARVDLRAAIEREEASGDPFEAIVDRLVLPLVDAAVPEMQAALNDLLALPELRQPVGYSGGVLAVGIRLALVEPRIAAAGFYAGSFVPRSMFEEARRVAIPVHVLLQWDDEGNDRQLALDVFDALGSNEKTLQANMGGHTGVPQHAADDAARFFERHLRP